MHPQNPVLESKDPVILRPDNSFEVKKLAELARVSASRMVTWRLFFDISSFAHI
jgi:hypothetical protein